MEGEPPARSRSADLLLLAVLCVVAVGLFFHRLGERDLWSSHEARAAMNARSLLRPDSPGMPRLDDGRWEVQKPPLYYWLVAGTAWMRDGCVDPLAVRLPAALAAAGVVACVAGFAATAGRPVAGLLAGLILACGIHFPWLARIGRIDMPLTLMVVVSSLAFLRALDVGPRRLVWLWIGYLAAAGGFLLKGPIGAALPGGVVAAWLLACGRWPAIWEGRAWRRLLGELGVLWGVPLVVLVCLPVFLWADHVTRGEFTREFFWVHNLQRGLGGSRLRSHPWWLYAPYLAVYLLPASPLLVLVFLRGWRGDRLARMGLAWMLAVIVLLSASRFKRADYLLPAYPGAALLLGCLLERLWMAHRRARAGIVAVAVLMVLGWTVRIERGLVREEPYRDYRPFAALVRRHAPAPEEVVFFRTEAHALAYHIGRPLAVLVEWPRLHAMLRKDEERYLVMPPHVAANATRALPGIRLENLGSNAALAGGRHERPLVLLRATPVNRVSNDPR